MSQKWRTRKRGTEDQLGLRFIVQRAKELPKGLMRLAKSTVSKREGDYILKAHYEEDGKDKVIELPAKTKKDADSLEEYLKSKGYKVEVESLKGRDAYVVKTRKGLTVAFETTLEKAREKAEELVGRYKNLSIHERKGDKDLDLGIRYSDIKRKTIEKYRYTIETLRDLTRAANDKRLYKRKDNIKVYLVDAKRIKSLDPNFSISGSWKSHKYIPKNQIWIDKKLSKEAREFLTKHELKQVKGKAITKVQRKFVEEKALKKVKPKPKRVIKKYLGRKVIPVSIKSAKSTRAGYEGSHRIYLGISDGYYVDANTRGWTNVYRGRGLGRKKIGFYRYYTDKNKGLKEANYLASHVKKE